MNIIDIHHFDNHHSSVTSIFLTEHTELTERRTNAFAIVHSFSVVIFIQKIRELTSTFDIGIQPSPFLPSLFFRDQHISHRTQPNAQNVGQMHSPLFIHSAL